MQKDPNWGNFDPLYTLPHDIPMFHTTMIKQINYEHTDKV